MIYKILQPKILIFVIAVMMAVSVSPTLAASDPALSITLSITKDNKITLENLALQEGLTSLTGGTGPYEFLLTGGFLNLSTLYRYKFDVRFSFCSYSEKCFDLDKSGIEIATPYFSNVKKIVVKRDGITIFSQNIKKLLCTRDNQCGTFENFLSCPLDCPTTAKDNICNSRYLDGVCDRDCLFDTETSGDCDASFVSLRALPNSDTDREYVCMAARTIKRKEQTAALSNLPGRLLAYVGGQLASLFAVLSNDCNANAPWGTNYQGSHNQIGFTNQPTDGRFFCYSGKFYECGWESTLPDFALEATDQQKVGNRFCELKTATWKEVVIEAPTNDCSVTAPWGTVYKGINEKIGFTNQPTDGRFLCYQKKFYECGWEQTSPTLAIEATQNQRVGSLYCDLQKKVWSTAPVAPTPIVKACTEADWKATLSPLVCPSTGKQTKTWTKLSRCEGGISHPISQITTCVPLTLPASPVSGKCATGCALPSWLTNSEDAFYGDGLERGITCIEPGATFTVKKNSMINIKSKITAPADESDYLLKIISPTSANFRLFDGAKFNFVPKALYKISPIGWKEVLPVQIEEIFIK